MTETGVTTTDASGATPAAAEAFAEKVFTAALGCMETFSLYLGEQTGWIAALADGPLSATELALRTGTAERYAREWLEMQAVYGNLTPDDPATDPSARRFALAPGAAEVLHDGRSLAYLGALPRLLAAVAGQLDGLLTAYRLGGGVSWAQLGDHARTAQADLNRPWFETALAPALASVPALHAILARPGAQVVDIGCGAGWSSIALARAYPTATVLGLDIDGPSVRLAVANAVAARLADRVSFREASATTLDLEVDAVFAFECLHDMPQPVEVLAAVRRCVRPDGAVVVMDEAVAADFTAPGDAVEQLMYGFSTLVCLADALSSAPSVGTGTVLRPATLDAYARQAGFASVEVLPIDGFAFFRFYRLRAEPAILRKS